MELRIIEPWNTLGHLPPAQVSQTLNISRDEAPQPQAKLSPLPCKGKTFRTGFGPGLAVPGHPETAGERAEDALDVPAPSALSWELLARTGLPHLRLLDRGRRQGECLPSSSVTLSVLRKCLERKCSSSGVGWYGSWCRRSWEDEDDWKRERDEEHQ